MQNFRLNQPLLDHFQTRLVQASANLVGLENFNRNQEVHLANSVLEEHILIFPVEIHVWNVNLVIFQIKKDHKIARLVHLEVFNLNPGKINVSKHQ